MFALSKNVRSTRKKFPFQLFGHVYKKCSPFQNCSQLKKIVLNLKSCPHFKILFTNSKKIKFSKNVLGNVHVSKNVIWKMIEF